MAKDFANAHNWLEDNAQNIKVNWPPAHAAEALRDLDDRLTRAFSSKIAIAIFDACVGAKPDRADQRSVQDNHAIGQKLSHQMERINSDLPAQVGAAVRDANVHGLREAIRMLREEEVAARPSARSGFTNGEAEKVISALIDQLVLAEEQRTPERSPTTWAAPSLPYSPPPPTNGSMSPPPRSADSASSRRMVPDLAQRMSQTSLEASSYAGASTYSGYPSASYDSHPTSRSSADPSKGKQRSSDYEMRSSKAPPVIGFSASTRSMPS